MQNLIKTRPSVGDICIIVDGKKRFVAGADCTTAFIDSQQCLGVVYDVQGNYVRIVAGSNTTSKKWSLVADYEITAIPSESGSYAVTLNNVTQGNFTYTKSEGTIEEFATQLNAWLAAQATGTKARKWEAYTSNGHSYLQMKTYDEYESTNTIASTTLVKLVASELAPYETTYNRNAVKQQTYCNAMCYQRMLEYAANNNTSSFNPTTRMNGTTQLFATYPCSKIYYDGALGDGLRENYATYADYMRACMIRLRELNHGIMQWRDGKLFTDLLYAKTVLVNGVSTKPYDAAVYCKDFDSGVPGYGAGTFWLPSMYELGLLMANLTEGTTAELDAVNTALSKKTGWTKINTTSYRWSSARFNSSSAWNYNYNGYSNFNYFYNSFAVSPVSAFEI